MPMISCDMRYGRTDEQKRALSAGLLRVVSEATGEPPDNILLRDPRGPRDQFCRTRQASFRICRRKRQRQRPHRKSEVKEATNAVHRMPRRNRSFPAPKTKPIRDIVKVTHQSIGSDPKIINVILVEHPEANMSISGRIYGEASK